MTLSKSLFFMTAAATTGFVITILAMVAMLVGDPNMPLNLWFNDHGATVMIVEVVAIGILGLSAMIADRYETLRELKNHAVPPSSESVSDAETKTPPKP